MGCRTVVLTNLSKKNPPKHILDNIDEIHNIDTSDPYAIYRFFKDYLIDPDTRFLAMLDAYIPLVSRICKNLCIPFIDQRSAQACARKDKMLPFVKKAGFSIPKTIFLRSGDSASKLSKLKFPLVLKPVDEAGGHGFCIVKNIQKAKKHISLLKKNKINIFGLKAAQIVMAQELIQGEEFSIELVLNKTGKPIFSNVTLKDLSDGLYRVQLGHTLPAPISKKLENKLVSLTSLLCQNLELFNVSVHCEIIIKEDEIYFIEMSGRGPGGRIDDAIDLSYGIDFHKLTIENTFSIAKKIKKKKKPEFSYITYMVTPKKGKLKKINGIISARKCKGVKKVVQTKPIGAQLFGLINSINRVGVLIACGKTPEQARKRALKAVKKIRIDVA